MIFTNDERIEALKRGEWPSGVPQADIRALRDAVHALDAAAALEDTLYAGQRTLVSSNDEGAAITSTLEARIGYTSSGVSMTQSGSVSSASVARRSTQRSVAEPITPGRFLREKVLRPERLTQSDLARSMGVSRLTVNEIINDRRTVTAEMALRLEAVTRLSASMWLNLQRNVELHRAKVQLADVLPRLSPITRKREFVDLKTDPKTSTGD